MAMMQMLARDDTVSRSLNTNIDIITRAVHILHLDSHQIKSLEAGRFSIIMPYFVQLSVPRHSIYQ